MPRQVSDFGLSMLMKPGQDQALARQHGTLAYMPPELITEDALSFATDVYSFGILLWEMFAAKVLLLLSSCATHFYGKASISVAAKALADRATHVSFCHGTMPARVCVVSMQICLPCSVYTHTCECL